MAHIIYTIAALLAILAAILAAHHGSMANALWLSATAVIFAVAAVDSRHNPTW